MISLKRLDEIAALTHAMGMSVVEQRELVRVYRLLHNPPTAWLRVLDRPHADPWRDAILDEHFDQRDTTSPGMTLTPLYEVPPCDRP